MSLPRHSLLEPFDWNGLSFNFTEKDDEFLCARDGTGSPRRAAAFPIKYRSPCDVLVLRANVRLASINWRNDFPIFPGWLANTTISFSWTLGLSRRGLARGAGVCSERKISLLM